MLSDALTLKRGVCDSAERSVSSEQQSTTFIIPILILKPPRRVQNIVLRSTCNIRRAKRERGHHRHSREKHLVPVESFYRPKQYYA
jgi:hypothetical protein